MRPRRAVLLAALALAAALAVASRAGAQISPGPLSRAHAALDGDRGCLSCHSPKKGVDAALCLSCHRALADRVTAHLGLHAKPGYTACERCHPEHAGRGFELVAWQGSRDAFDHARAGWPLAGKHAGLACARCHRPEAVAAEVRRREPTLDPGRTFLGLSTACASCHADPHRGTLSATCTDCHGAESWKVSGGFDHARTRYPLENAHARVACLECHKQPAIAAVATKTLVFDQFRAAGGRPSCASCHRDPHSGKLGADCARCHDTRSFRAAPAAGFDHERTAYPLRGRHREVACAKCHPAGRELRVPGFERCASCHRDPHLGQLRSAAAGGACADCHTVDGFRPARFDLAAHARSRFPLGGAHRAVPCSACHREVAASALPAPFAAPASVRAQQFRFAAARCRDCHRDPHGGELDRFAGQDGCASCHDDASWRSARLDHARTRFPLAGAHVRVACAQCHPTTTAAAVRFDGRPLECAGCHRDVHAGQFARGAVTDCARCHDQERFRPAPGFDHARTRFPLDGRHVRVACSRCHPAETTAAGETLVRYAPRPLECAGCHASGAAGG